jgi:hypothetical protein
LSIYTPLPVQSPENAKPQITRKTSNEADYFSQIEVIKWGSWMSEDTWIVEGMNRYFIPDPSPKHDESTVKEVTNDARKSVSTPAGAHELRDGSNLSTKIQTDAGRASVEKTDLQTSKEDSLGSDSTQSAQAKGKASPPSLDAERKTLINPRPNAPEIPTSALIERLEENPPPGFSPTVVASEEENPAKDTKVGINTIMLEDCISTGERPASAEKMLSSSQQTSRTKASTTKQDNLEIHVNAIVPKKGLAYGLLRSSDGISQVFKINGLGPNGEIVQLKEVDSLHHIMEP